MDYPMDMLDLMGAGGWLQEQAPSSTINPNLLSNNGYQAPTSRFAPPPSPHTVENIQSMSFPSGQAQMNNVPTFQDRSIVVPTTQQQFQQTRSYLPPSRAQSYAEVAHLPFQRHGDGGIPPPALPLPPMRSMRPLSLRLQQIAPASPNQAPPVPASPPTNPVFRLDMRQNTPPNFMSSHEFTHSNMHAQGAINPGERMAGWLQHPMAIGERTGLPVNNSPLSPLSPRMVASPARSNAGMSDLASSSRRSRKERQRTGAHKCGQCREGFYNSEDLRRHIDRVHGNWYSRPYACVQCFWRFFHPKDLDRHQKTHLPREPKFWCFVEGCQFATKGFTTKWSYDRHVGTHLRADSGVQMSRSTTSRGWDSRG